MMKINEKQLLLFGIHANDSNDDDDHYYFFWGKIALKQKKMVTMIQNEIAKLFFSFFL